MIIAGNCSFTNIEEKDYIIDTAERVKEFADLFRCKIWLGGTTPDKYFYGAMTNGIDTLNFIDKNIIPAGTECHTPGHFDRVYGLSFIWIGARNSSNYSLLEYASHYEKDLMVKRNPGMTIDELYGLYDIMRDINHKKVYIIERGILTFDRLSDSRWSPDLKGVIRIKDERPDIFDRLVIDCSHSVGRKEYIEDTYKAFKSIGCKHFMFECTVDGKSKTDSRQMLSTNELKNIIRG